MEQLVAHFLSQFTYLAIIVVLAAAGLGVPISEDLTLLLGGALAARGLTSFWPTLLAGYCGVIFGDVLIHRWGMKLGPLAWSKPFVQRALSPARQERLRTHFARRGFLTVVIGRHTPVARAPVFFLAGASGVSFGKFLAADAFSAAITVPIVVTLGFKFGEHLDQVKAWIHEAQWTAGGLFLVVALGVILWRRLAKRAAAES